MKIQRIEIRGMTIRTIANGWAPSRALRAATLLGLLSLAAGCTANGPSPMASAQGFGPTVAFESVDGPPPEVFDRLVKALETESTGRSFSIISREAPASYRVRSYLSAQVSRGKTTIAWVWDVYDRDKQRALRLNGEEPAGKGQQNAWASADDGVMRRIARAGLEGLNGLIDGTAPEQDQPAPGLSPSAGPAVATIDRSGPETAPVETRALAFNGQ